MDTQFKNPTMLSLSFHFPLSQNMQKTEHIVEQKKQSSLPLDLSSVAPNRPFSKMAAENSNKLRLAKIKNALELETRNTRKNTFTLVTRRSLSISGVISAEKM